MDEFCCRLPGTLWTSGTDHLPEAAGIREEQPDPSQRLALAPGGLLPSVGSLWIWGSQEQPLS